MRASPELGIINGPVTLAGNSSLDLTANAPLTVGALTLNEPVTVNISGKISLTSAATYILLQHGVESGSGAFKLVLPAGLMCNGLTGTLVDTGTQLQLVVSPVGITGTIADVRHVVILMDENRSFDHYFGTFHDVRGFNDRNALHFTNQTSDFYQPSGSSYELPFHTSLQCLTDLNHTWPVTHATIDGGKNDQWIPNKGTETMVYFERSDLPYYYALADAYTICDDYHCSVLSSTDPNRVSLMTGMIDPNGTGGGPEIDNTRLASGFTWTTYPELLQQAGVTWNVYQVAGDNSDNVLPAFAVYKQASPGNPLYDHARVGAATLDDLVSAFQKDVASNTLPSVSWIIGPSTYTEHPPYSPANGEVLTKELLDALSSNPQVYNSTVFIFNYDENDGFFDHAMPILPPSGTPNEYVGSPSDWSGRACACNYCFPLDARGTCLLAGIRPHLHHSFLGKLDRCQRSKYQRVAPSSFRRSDQRLRFCTSQPGLSQSDRRYRCYLHRWHYAKRALTAGLPSSGDGQVGAHAFALSTKCFLHTGLRFKQYFHYYDQFRSGFRSFRHLPQCLPK
jgi:hypothetical protein